MKPSFVEGAVEVVKIIAYICFSTEKDKNLMSDSVKIMSVHVIKLFGAISPQVVRDCSLLEEPMELVLEELLKI